MSAADVKGEQARITRFFSGPYNNFIFKARYVLIALLTIVGICAGVIASGIGPLTQQEEFLPNSDPLMVLQKEVEDNFKPLGTFSSAGNVKGSIYVNLNWGVKDLDRDDVGAWESDNAGVLIWDDNFTVSPKENQQFMLDFCNELMFDTDVVLDEDVKCWILELDNFVKSDSAAKGSPEQLPIDDEARFEKYLMRFITETEVGGDYAKGQLLGFDVNTGKLKFMRVTAKSKGRAQDPRLKKLPIRDSWDKIVDDFSAKAPEGLSYVHHDASVIWSWMQSE